MFISAGTCAIQSPNVCVSSLVLVRLFLVDRRLLLLLSLGVLLLLLSSSRPLPGVASFLLGFCSRWLCPPCILSFLGSAFSVSVMSSSLSVISLLLLSFKPGVSWSAILNAFISLSSASRSFLDSSASSCVLRLSASLLSLRFSLSSCRLLFRACLLRSDACPAKAESSDGDGVDALPSVSLKNCPGQFVALLCLFHPCIHLNSFALHPMMSWRLLSILSNAVAAGEARKISSLKRSATVVLCRSVVFLYVSIQMVKLSPSATRFFVPSHVSCSCLSYFFLLSVMTGSAP